MSRLARFSKNEFKFQEEKVAVLALLVLGFLDATNSRENFSTSLRFQDTCQGSAKKQARISGKEHKKKL
jgi:hypothetical protein